jgi:FlaA1/EpsC-like NDP-sugar epimerase
MIKFYKDKKILITGAAGTVGREIVKQLVSFEPTELRLMDNNETEMFFLMEEYEKGNVFCFLGDIRDRDKLEKLSKDVDIIIHCAAFKHVYLSEYNPFDVVQTNIIGVENVIRAATACNVKQVLFTSSDKAVNPTNVMGTSKLMGERLMTAASAVRNDSSTIFSSTRFGNVLGSRGSVVPLFMKQIRNGGPVTVTDKRMTRFVMTIKEAARLVLQSVMISKGGEVFVTKMPVVRIPDLAEVMIKLLAPKYG